MNTINSLSSNQCCGCAACMDTCPVHAIKMKEDEYFNRRAIVENSLCVECGLCTKICPCFHELESSSFVKKAFVAFACNKILTEKSSSGGLFSIFASYVIRKGGVVYGAAMTYEDGILICKHIRIECIQDLQLLQGSKYVQSRTDGVYAKVKQDLKEGKSVLFSGTSCQTASLKRFVKDHEHLITVDLVCHGVPKDRFFRDYVIYLEQKYRIKVINMSFRSKKRIKNGKKEMFKLSLQCKTRNSQILNKEIKHKKSSYYSMFLSKGNYRDSCYHCTFATLQKPGDITLGDFIPKKNEILQYGFSSEEYYSSVIVHNEKGRAFLNAVKEELTIWEIPMKQMLKHHHNLKMPSAKTLFGEKMVQLYMKEGYSGLQKNVDKKYRMHLVKTNMKFLLSSVCNFFRKK